MLHNLKNAALAAACGLLLTTAPALAQTAPAPKIDHYYLDGQPSTKEAVEALQKSNPQSIDRVDVLTGKQATDYTHDPNTKGVVLVKTK